MTCHTNQENVEALAQRECARRTRAGNDFHYVRARFSDAVRTLCIGQGDVKDRLRGAFGSLSLAEMAAARLPDDLFQPDLKHRLNEIIKSMTYKLALPPYHRMGTMWVTLRLMRRKTASRIAQNIWDLHDCLQAGYWVVHLEGGKR